MWKQDIWQEIRQRVSCLDVAPIYGYRPNTGGFIPCPFHHERTGSCKLYPGDGGYHCFGCGAHGDVIDFVSRVAGLSRIDAARELDRQYSIGLEFGPERPNRPRHYDADGYKRRLDEAIQAVQQMDVPRLLELIKQHRVAYRERPPAHILETHDPVLIRSYMVGNVYAVGGPNDYGSFDPPPAAHREKASKWEVWLKTMHKYGTFEEELDALIDMASRQGKYTPLKALRDREEPELIEQIILDELKEYNHE